MHLIIYMHPAKESFNRTILEKYQKAWQTSGEKVIIRDLYQLSLSPLLTRSEYKRSLQGVYDEEIKREQEMIAQAGGITLVFPVWWGGFPAIGKGYLDRVLSYGFAYELEEERPIPKMNQKPLGMIYTTGSPAQEWQRERVQMEGLFKMAVADFCGFLSIAPLHIGNAHLADAAEREKMFEEVKNYTVAFTKYIER